MDGEVIGIVSAMVVPKQRVQKAGWNVGGFNMIGKTIVAKNSCDLFQRDVNRG